MTQALVHERPKEISSDSPKHVAVKYWVLLIFAVLVAFGPLVLTNQSFWDDWVLIAHAKAGTLGELFKQAGRREQFLLMAPFAFEGGARACTIVALALSCALGPLIYTIIRRAARWPAEDAFWAALLGEVAFGELPWGARPLPPPARGRSCIDSDMFRPPGR